MSSLYGVRNVSHEMMERHATIFILATTREIFLVKRKRKFHKISDDPPSMANTLCTFTIRSRREIDCDALSFQSLVQLHSVSKNGFERHRCEICKFAGLFY